MLMVKAQPFTTDELVRLTGSAIAKIDLLGPRGTTLCTMDEIEAMAVWIVLTSTLPGHPTDPHRQPYYVEKERSNETI